MASSASIAVSPRKMDTSALSIGRLSDLKQRRLQYTEEMAKHTVQLESVTEYLDILLPRTKDIPELPKLSRNPFKSLKRADAMVEKDVTDLFLEAVETHHLSPNLAMRRSESRPDSISLDVTRQKVDAAFFKPEDAPNDGRPHWIDQYLPVEFKNRKQGNKFDPFDDRTHGIVEADAILRKQSRGQVISYAELLLALQHRTFLFMLLIVGRRFRLLRWDRSGVIITRSTDYYKKPELLREFLWRVSYASPDALGLDPTAVRLPRTPRNISELQGILADLEKRAVDHTPRQLESPFPKNHVFRYVLDLFKGSIAVEEWPLYHLWISERCFLVGKPVSPSHGVAGPGTRGYVAYDVKEKRLVWLKDTWRTWYDGVEAEGQVLGRLNDAGVRGVPTVICHSDIGNQVTTTGRLWEKKHPLPDAHPHTDPPPLFSSSTTPPFPVASGSVNRRSETGKSRGKDNKKRKRESLDTHYTTPTPLEPQDGYVPRFRVDCPIEHRKHCRIAFGEVCFPLKEFLNAQQLVHIILQCIYAAASHKLQVHVLHRNITDRNIMIYPRLKNTKPGVAPAVEWTGVLIDWASSKPIVGDNELHYARQPVFIGCWQFASANLLTNSLQPVKNADELESFLYVLIYYAVRYLESNLCDYDVASFIDQAFDCYSVYQEKIIVGQHKAILLRLGKLVYSSFDVIDISFDNPPLDSLISELLSWFQVYYSEAKLLPTTPSIHKATARECPGSPTPPPKKVAKRLEPASSSIRSHITHGNNRSRAATAGGDQPPQSRSDESPLERPPPRKITIPSHRGMIWRFLQVNDDPSWVSQPPVGDRVQSANYTSNVTLLDTIEAATVRPGAKLPLTVRKKL
ncbi:hypothetical protein DICSQDRAFT_170784 [Dichomitus squalens LYAD-421 SS1]|uniref:Fungal-type protein kinase domain-containing protein n=1 Tax=Dichomitus squalens (strain LYAD-421) TaxID=732165 RepID=R7SY89_DICSQ|nr:uncharacterized protein DICSQDRAFT_170784 [Dichomitus squalens LYAD-421 SS1]EJF60928.1 hypothetical protein DICSQDRAFT_170784 [Dichomitus squalens LYAD-421 SS1]